MAAPWHGGGGGGRQGSAMPGRPSPGADRGRPPYGNHGHHHGGRDTRNNGDIRGNQRGKERGGQHGNRGPARGNIGIQPQKQNGFKPHHNGGGGYGGSNPYGKPSGRGHGGNGDSSTYGKSGGTGGHGGKRGQKNDVRGGRNGYGGKPTTSYPGAPNKWKPKIGNSPPTAFESDNPTWRAPWMSDSQDESYSAVPHRGKGTRSPDPTSIQQSNRQPRQNRGERHGGTTSNPIAAFRNSPYAKMYTVLIFGAVVVVAGVVVLVTNMTDSNPTTSSNGTTAPTKDTFDIDVRIIGEPPPAEILSALDAAVSRWSQVISGDLPDITLKEGIRCGSGTLAKGEVLDDLVIFASFADIDGEGNILGAAAFCHQDSNKMPRTGEMQFDLADLEILRQESTLTSVLLHEIGHVLGIGSLWDANLVTSSATGTLEYTGTNGIAGLESIQGSGRPLVEDQGEQGTRGVHWKENTYMDELMTGILSGPEQPMSLLTVESLKDLGYAVVESAADDFAVPIARSNDQDVPGRRYGSDILQVGHHQLSDDGYELNTSEESVGIGFTALGGLVLLTASVAYFRKSRQEQRDWAAEPVHSITDMECEYLTDHTGVEDDCEAHTVSMLEVGDASATMLQVGAPVTTLEANTIAKTKNGISVEKADDTQHDTMEIRTEQPQGISGEGEHAII